MYQWLGKVIPGPVAITAADNGVVACLSLFGHAVVTDASQSGGGGRRDKQELKKLAKHVRVKASTVPQAGAVASDPIPGRRSPASSAGDNSGAAVRQLISATAPRTCSLLPV